MLACLSHSCTLAMSALCARALVAAVARKECTQKPCTSVADKNFKRHFGRHLESAPSRAPQRHPPADLPPLGCARTHPVQGGRTLRSTPELGRERCRAARAEAGHTFL